MYRSVIGAVLCALSVATASGQSENMTDSSRFGSPFGDAVLLFRPDMDMDAIQRTLDALHARQANDEFSARRYALLFAPGEYDLDVTVDYYVQAAGLGQVPGDVVIKGTVQSIATTRENRVTIMFWRSAENFRVVPSKNPVFWAVSQAAPYRRMHIAGDLQFDLGGWASGGLLANSIVDGTAGLTTGQQWLTRNAELGGWTGGNWNRTFVGAIGAPSETFPAQPTTVVDRTPVIRDKPFLVLRDSEWSVFRPSLQHNTRGVSWKTGGEDGQHIPLSQFHIAHPSESAQTLNAALYGGKHLLLTPGIYSLDAPLRVRHANTLIFGLGLATLVPTNGNAAVTTDDVSGVVIAGIMVDAGPELSPVLVRIGERDSRTDHSRNPISLHDVYCRVGGAIVGRAGTCLEINSDDVILDHTWLWRADHGAGARWTDNEADHGLVVNGDDVTIYGLFNEHFQKHQTVWNGERGRVFFYQSEIPYDPPSQSEWMNGPEKGFASYRVAETVDNHYAVGLGIYSFFGVREPRDPGVRLGTAIETPAKKGICIENITTFAGGYGGIDHSLNHLGPKTNVGETQFFKGVCKNEF